MLKPSIVLFLGLGALAVPSAHAETFRCGQRIASPEMSVEELIEACGEPSQRSAETVDVYGRSASGGRIKTGTSVVETLTFDRGNAAAAMVVTVVDGRIKSMERAK
jgi:uncharacterized protein DUF2845